MDEPSSQKLLGFLRSLQNGEREASHLFLLGDIFDLWIADHNYFAQKFAPIVHELSQIVKSSVQVYYFEGNHDLHLKKFWQEEHGIKVFTDKEYISLGSYQVRIEHGDFINPDDKAYLRLRAFLRSKFMHFLSYNLPGKLVALLGEKSSEASRKRSSVVRKSKEELLRKMIRTYAEKSHKIDPHFDLLITGHMHVKDDYSFNSNGKEIRSINLGSWLDEPMALEINASGIHWHRL